MEMQTENLEGIARALRQGIAQGLIPAVSRLAVQVVQQIVAGQPVSPAQLEEMASNVGVSHDVLDQFQARFGEFDPEGNIVGLAGMTLKPTQHRFVLDGRTLYNWCGLDGLMFAPLLKQAARLESLCPGSGTEIRITVTPEGVEHVEPASAVLSVVVPRVTAKSCDEARGLFCDFSHFFSSPEAASSWLPNDQDVTVLSVEEGYRLGRMMTEALFQNV